MRRILAFALLVIGTASAAVAGMPAGLKAAIAAWGKPVAVTASPVEITGGRVTGLRAEGAWVLDGNVSAFGGLSGLVVRDGRLIAMSDDSWFLSASLDLSGAGLRLDDAVMVEMRDGAGDHLTRGGRDSEGLTLADGALVVSFERDHRLMTLADDGRMGGTVQPRSFERMPLNKGLEALATLPDGRLLALGEGPEKGAAPMFLIGPGGITEGHLPLDGPQLATGADVGPDGRLYVLFRDFSYLSGFSIRVRRYALGADGFPVPASVETLAAYETGGGIDNMEGISVEREPDGTDHVWLISDDNFNFFQRTLLMRFAVER